MMGLLVQGSPWQASCVHSCEETHWTCGGLVVTLTGHSWLGHSPPPRPKTHPKRGVVQGGRGSKRRLPAEVGTSKQAWRLSDGPHQAPYS